MNAHPSEGIIIEDSRCFDQLCNLKTFVEANCKQEDFKELLVHERWVKYFDSCNNDDCFTSLLVITVFLLLRTLIVFSPMQSHVDEGENQSKC